MTLTRRHLLAGFSTGMLAPMPARAATPGSTLVIGAGLAGLSAARDLVAAGGTVTILEARDRVGGRIWTSRRWKDLPMDLGASWIHGTKGNPLTQLAEKSGAKRVATSYDSSMALDGEGRETDLTAAYDEGEELIAAAQQMASRLEKDMSLKSAIEMMTDWRKADAGERRLLRHVINGTAEAEYGGAWSELSAWHFDDSKEFGGGDVLFPGGYDQIISHLAKGLDIRTGKPVTAIAPQGDGVVVTLADGTVMTADQALVTVPLGVLQAKGISFGAPLAKARRAAVAALGMGLLNKCWLRFERIAWPDDVDWIEWLGPRDGHWEQWVSLARAAKAPVLLGFHAGDMAREMERLSDAEMMQAAHGALKAMFGSDFPAPLDGQITRWSRDPHAFGSYSYHAVGSSPASRKALAGADWEGRLVFAGEACSARYWGTAHGAVLSGREAAEIIAAR